MHSKCTARTWRRALLAVALLAVGCTDNSTNGDVDLPPAPAGVTDLRVTIIAPDWVELAWTAPIEDDEHGPVATYDIRYTEFEPDESDWDNATRVTWTSNPLPGGLTETFQVTGLTSGVTYYFALKCCDNNDQCSPISNLADALLPTEFEIDFPDSALEVEIRAALGQPAGPIMYSSVLGITSLSVEDGDVADLTGLEYCENLQYLFLLGNDITDLSPLAELENVRVLNLNNNNISDISPLSGMTSVEQIDLGFNPLSDISALSTLTELIVLNVHDDVIVDLAPLAGLTKLHLLDVTYNHVTDISPLVANTGLADGDEVSLTGNPLSESAINEHIPALEARGVVVTF